MTNQELQAQYKRCQLMNDAAEWDYLAAEFYAAGYPLNALNAWQTADEIRGCSFSEAMTARALPLAGVEVEG
jgi:hypothetical protein